MSEQTTRTTLDVQTVSVGDGKQAVETKDKTYLRVGYVGRGGTWRTLSAFE